jgi:hypothetical protein
MMMMMMMTAATQTADPSLVERVLSWAIRVLHAARQAPMSQLVLVLGALLAGICAALIGLVSGTCTRIAADAVFGALLLRFPLFSFSSSLRR